ncbi:hypothetical protein AZC_3429 [Azorhizobium caulinodans ORS 571]|uniref:Uncharacterized protein n=1 Tax=Azorhizobium caulinodans (strain ATCC 43989 / DSM 5975 / JCM 20966 / LMG 6465 / NBRC 14845 / NCIMB 13405 / ORS 571) TaxID=438753 RepID=A8IIN6_AZOC5|nr:hypothetical protein [Azorhizobium caulinodans]BAF89427.1 hypothetical protein AZC_3429 [Azorhizobium caulinodans ORS 571]
MTVAQLIAALSSLPADAVVLMDCDGGLASIDSLDFIAGEGPGAPSEVILQPSLEE